MKQLFITSYITILYSWMKFHPLSLVTVLLLSDELSSLGPPFCRTSLTLNSLQIVNRRNLLRASLTLFHRFLERV